MQLLLTTILMVKYIVVRCKFVYLARDHKLIDGYLYLPPSGEVQVHSCLQCTFCLLT